jgi:hypothetical protein
MRVFLDPGQSLRDFRNDVVVGLQTYVFVTARGISRRIIVSTPPIEARAARDAGDLPVSTA